VNRITGMRMKLMALVLALGSFSAGVDQRSGEELFKSAVKVSSGLKDCVVKFQLSTSSGGSQDLRLYAEEDAKYLHSPLLYYQKRTKVEANYKEQATAGFQEIYRSDTDMVELLMPGALRALGVIRVYPEDPKTFGMNGGCLKNMAPWDVMDGVAEMARKGTLRFETALHKGKECLVFDVTKSGVVGFHPNVSRVRLLIDAQTLLPVRLEEFFPGQSKASTWTEWTEFKANTGLVPGQIAFEGFKNPVSLIKSPLAKEIDPFLKPVPRTRLVEPAPEAKTLVGSFSKAADAISSYRADLTMSFRYGRLRLFRADRFAYHRSPYYFVLVTTAQKADYLLLNHSAGSVLWIDPAARTFHIIGGGVQRILGEQVFSESDYKFYSSLGDNPYELDFAHIQAMLPDFNLAKAEAWTVNHQGRKMHELKLERPGELPPRTPGRINLVIDPETSLPRVIELSGYDDPQAYVAVTVDNIKTGVELKPGQTKF